MFFPLPITIESHYKQLPINFKENNFKGRKIKRNFVRSTIAMVNGNRIDL